MAEDKKQQTGETGQQGAGDNVHGRTYNSQNPAFEQQGAQHDISGIDQQEGNMEHGEQGANFNEQKKEA